MSSKRHFDKIKSIFKIENVEEMKKIISDYLEREKKLSRRLTGFPNAFARLYLPEELIDTDSIGIYL
jgi:hypothetical protein